MRCPYCGFGESKVADSRAAEEGNSIRRRRECVSCERRFTTYEVVEETPLIVVKKDNRRVIFDKTKLTNGIIRACEKRPVLLSTIQEMARKVEKELKGRVEREITTELIGETVMTYLKEIDQVAYVRFVSVYRQFADINTFMDELQVLLRSQVNRNKIF